MARATRRQIISSVAKRLQDGESRPDVLRGLAAYLLDHKQTSQADLYVADIERELAKGGSLVADVTTARPLDDASRALVEDYVLKAEKASAVTLREHIDPTIIGGIIIRVNGRELDAAVSSQIRQLKIA